MSLQRMILLNFSFVNWLNFNFFNSIIWIKIISWTTRFWSISIGTSLFVITSVRWTIAIRTLSSSRRAMSRFTILVARAIRVTTVSMGWATVTRTNITIACAMFLMLVSFIRASMIEAWLGSSTMRARKNNRSLGSILRLVLVR